MLAVPTSSRLRSAQQTVAAFTLLQTNQAQSMLLFGYSSIFQRLEKKSTGGGVEITPFEGMPGKGALRQM